LETSFQIETTERTKTEVAESMSRQLPMRRTGHRGEPLPGISAETAKRI
jgi:hypothetical protein